MYGGSGKLGRGGGGGRGAAAGGNKRNIHSTFHPSPLHSLSSAAAAAAVPPSSGRLSMGGGGGAVPRNRAASVPAASASSSLSSSEESFSLVTGNPLNFAMIIRLAPDLVEEIKRAEFQGSAARIKFDANSNNPAGNVISVGGKDFRFTWSRETGDLCDIYEERQGGEDGNGLLVESGSAWRKLNVQRVLDESTTNHVKMRSEEAERKNKSRKAIVLDPGNPSMKSNVKAMVAAESNSSWRMKKAPFKKRKAEPPPGGPPKSVQKSGLIATSHSKSKPPASSPSSPPHELVVPGSPIGSGNLLKGHADIEDIVSVQAMNKTVNSEKDNASRVISSIGRGKPGQKAQPANLRSVLISLLGKSASKGMSLKALEKAVVDAIPNSVRQIEPILKKIATFEASGRYFLNPGIEIESFKKPSSDCQSSPEDNNHQSPSHDDQKSAPDSVFPVRSDAPELKEHAELDHKYGEALNLVERGDVPYQSTDLLCEKKVSDNSKGPIGSSSDSGSESDSDSDSSDSGSDSGTRSRTQSRSPGGSGSGSSSDSESDDSAKSKEASDEDVDIMTSDDDKQGKHKWQASGIGSLKSPLIWNTSDGEHARIMSDEKQDGHVTDVIEIEKDSLEDQPARVVDDPSDSFRNKEVQNPVQEITPPLYYRNEDQDRHDYIHRETGNASKDGFDHGQFNISEKASKSKYKRVSDEMLECKPDRSKRLKYGNSHQSLASGSRPAPFRESHRNPSPVRAFEDLNRGASNQVVNRIKRDSNSGIGSQKSYAQTSSGKSTSDSQQPTQRSADPSSREKTSSSVERPSKHSENMSRGAKPPERLQQMTGGFPIQKDKLNREMQDHKGTIKVSKEDFVEKHTTPVDSHHKKHEAFGNSKDFELVSNSPKDDNSNARETSAANGRPNVLQRELSDLELGELREPLTEGTSGLSKQLNRKNSFKQLENKTLSSETWNSDSSKAKLTSKMATDSRKSSPMNSNILLSGSSEGMSNKGIPEHFAEENSRPHASVVQTQLRPNQSRVDNVDTGTQPNSVVELNGRNRNVDVGRSVTPEINGNFQSRGSATMPQESEAKQGAALPSRKESRKQKSNKIPDLNDKQKDTSLTGSSDGHQKRVGSSSDETSWPYSKYEKDGPELKGPIKDGSQYKEYVEEFQEKYSVYRSINKILESYREEFLKYGRELEASKGKDMERYCAVERQVKESYRRSGERFKRLKRIFIVLHEELQHLKQMIAEFAAPYLKDLKD